MATNSKLDGNSDEKPEHEIAGYDPADLAKAPVTPPSPSGAQGERPEELIQEVKQEKTAPPSTTNKKFIIAGVCLLFLAAVLAVPFGLATVALIALIGIMGIIAGVFLKL